MFANWLKSITEENVNVVLGHEDIILVHVKPLPGLAEGTETLRWYRVTWRSVRRNTIHNRYVMAADPEDALRMTLYDYDGSQGVLPGWGGDKYKRVPAEDKTKNIRRAAAQRKVWVKSVSDDPKEILGMVRKNKRATAGSYADTLGPREVKTLLQAVIDYAEDRGTLEGGEVRAIVHYLAWYFRHAPEVQTFLDDPELASLYDTVRQFKVREGDLRELLPDLRQKRVPRGQRGDWRYANRLPDDDDLDLVLDAPQMDFAKGDAESWPEYEARITKYIYDFFRWLQFTHPDQVRRGKMKFRFGSEKKPSWATPAEIVNIIFKKDQAAGQARGKEQVTPDEMMALLKQNPKAQIRRLR